MHSKQFIQSGKPLGTAEKVLLMIHGRGGTAEDILSLSTHLDVKDFTFIAPQATGNTWYPYSFMAPVAQNEPSLSSALSLLQSIVTEVQLQGITTSNIYFAGFSQGACLLLEFITRNAVKYGGVAAFTGGLIGQELQLANYTGDFNHTPVFIGTSDPDPHVPVERVHATASILHNMHASVLTKVYPDMGHTISNDEIKQANARVFNPHKQ